MGWAQVKLEFWASILRQSFSGNRDACPEFLDKPQVSHHLRKGRVSVVHLPRLPKVSFVQVAIGSTRTSDFDEVVVPVDLDRGVGALIGSVQHRIAIE
jgi:hypothetical protein